MPNANITKNDFTFPLGKTEKIIETGFMREVMNRTLAIHSGNAVWYGQSRIGKTTTARQFIHRINSNYQPENPNAFRAVHFEAGEISSWSGNEQKKGLKALYSETIGRIDEGSYQNDPIEVLVFNIVHGLRRKNVQMVLIDEAGNLSVGALRGILMVFDKAKNMNHPFSFVFIGMDDLPTKVLALPQIEGRIQEWCYFEKYTLTEMAEFLKELHPYFSHVNIKRPESLELVQCVYELFDGFPGLVIPFLDKVESYLRINPHPCTSKILRMVYLRTTMDKKNSINKSREIFGGRPLKRSRQGKKNGDAGGAKK